jgi:hypothetical protein
LIAAQTGEGKSTITANAAYSTLIQGKRVLILSNEEMRSSVYQRLTCLNFGWDFNKMKEFTEDQVKVLEEYTKKWAKRANVLDSNSLGVSGLTTSIEGIKGVLESLIANGTKVDAIFLDYYQNVSTSKLNPSATPIEVQAELSNYLDQFKNRYPAPIIVFSQLHPKGESEKTFEERLKGRKNIFEKATIAFEVRANKAERVSEWIIHKSRFHTIVQGQSVKLGWDAGKYVKITPEFKLKVEEMKMKNLLK